MEAYSIMPALNILDSIRLGKRKKFRFKNPIKLLDSTLISLCLSVFDWAHYKTHKGAVKMHALLDYDMLLPHYVLITNGKKGGNTAAKQILVDKGTAVVSDCYYCDFDLLLQAREAAAAHQKLCRHIAECGGDTAVDGPDYPPDAQISPIQGILRQAFV